MIIIKVRGERLDSIANHLREIGRNKERELGLPSVFSFILISPLEGNKLGTFNGADKSIAIDEALALNGNEEDTENVFLHEMAHALDFYFNKRISGHSPVFRGYCKLLGMKEGFEKSKVSAELKKNRNTKEKIEKLLSLASSPFENESITALKKAKELMAKSGQSWREANAFSAKEATSPLEKDTNDFAKKGTNGSSEKDINVFSGKEANDSFGKKASTSQEKESNDAPKGKGKAKASPWERANPPHEKESPANTKEESKDYQDDGNKSHRGENNTDGNQTSNSENKSRKSTKKNSTTSGQWGADSERSSTNSNTNWQKAEDEKIYLATLYKAKKIPFEMRLLATFIAKCTGVFDIIEAKTEERNITVYGSLEEVETAVYLYTWLIPTLEKELKKQKQQNPTTTKHSFYTGVLEGLIEKTEGNDDKALIAIKAENKDKALRLVFAKGTKIRKERARTSFRTSSGYASGKDIGRKLSVPKHSERKALP